MTTEEELIARIAEDPDSDGPRLVLADYYLQQGDPRGELMAIQLAPQPVAGQKARLRTLIKEQGPRLAGSLASVLNPRTMRFERGRLAGAETTTLTDAQRREVAGNPLWATVKELVTHDPTLVADPMMRSLRKATGFNIIGLALLGRGTRPLRVEEIWVWSAHLDVAEADRETIANTTCLPNLARLTMVLFANEERVTAERLAWLLRSPLGQRLEQFGIRGGLRPLDILKPSFATFREQYGGPVIEFGN